MARTPPPFYGPAKDRSRRAYYREGRRHLKAAMGKYPGLAPEEALIAAQKSGGPLAAATVLRYRADHKFILEVLLRRDRRAGEFERLWDRLDDALKDRKTRIAPEDGRTSAIKIVDATEQEARTLFGELKRHAISHKRLSAIVAALYALVAGHSGFRPVELVGARIVGSKLTLRTAKRRPGMPETRVHDLSALHEDIRVGIGLLIDLIPPDMTDVAFKDWHKALAAQMRRACVRVGTRVLSPYSFRHIAIASWARAGLSPVEIAELAGHLSPRTHVTHYARASVGHERKAVVTAVPVPVPPTAHMRTSPGARSADVTQIPPAQRYSTEHDLSKGVAAGGTRSAGGETGKRVQGDKFDFSDMPPAEYLPETTRRALSAEDIAAARARIPDAGDPETIAANIRAAQARRRDREQEQEQFAAPVAPPGRSDEEN